MPGYDGTGPMGQGPLTGGGLGPCGRGLGRGYGRGMGRGRGRGLGIRRGGRGLGLARQNYSPEDEVEALKREKELIEKEIESLEKGV